MSRVVYCLALAGLLVCSTAAAQNLFGVPGNPRLEPSDVSLPYGAKLLAIDEAGFVYSAQGIVSCHHRDDPATSYTLTEQSFFDANGTRTNAFVSGQLTPDGSAVEVAYVPYGGQTRPLEAVRLFRMSCRDLMPGGAGAIQLGGTLLRSDNVLLDHIRAADFVRSSSGALCFASNPAFDSASLTEPTSPFGIVCIDATQTPPTVTQLLDSADLDSALDVDPALAAAPNGLPIVHHGWSLRGLAPARDDRVFFYAERSYRWGDGPGMGASYLYVVERESDGTLAAHFGPVSAGSTWHPLVGAGPLVYSPALDAMVTQVVAQEHNWAAYADVVNTGFAGATMGWTGVGLRVLPLDAPGSGYLPLSRVVLQRHGCTTHIPYCNQLGQMSLFSTGDETLVSITRLTENPNLPAAETYVLALDLDDLDLDDDGLTAAEEAAAGTWDTVPDSDFGGTPDGVEVDFAQSDPLESEAEPARLAGVRGEIRYALSRLIGKHLGGIVGGDQIRVERPRTVGIDNPVCVGGGCYGPGGVRVSSYPVERQLGGSSSVVAADGSFIMLRTAEGLVRFYFEDAREELAVTAADLDAYVPTWSANDSSLNVIPLDATRTLLAADGKVEATRYPAVVALAEGDTITVLYDHAQAQRDSGLSVAEYDLFEPNDFGVMASIAIIGWNADTERLHFGVVGNWDTWLITLGLDGTAKVLGRGRALKGLNEVRRGEGSFAVDLFPPPLPAYLLPTGHGDYFASGAVMEPFGGYLPAQSTLISNMDLPPLSFWGDVLLETVCCGFNEDGLYELVRYERTVEPGDVLVLRPVYGTSGGISQGAMLYQSGPRGGLAELWNGRLPDVVDIGGIDLAPDGSMRLCIADRSHAVVWELEPAGPDGVPEIIRYTADVPGIVDCAYDGEGQLSVLATGPARVEVRADDFGDLTVSETLPSAPEPLELVRKPDGKNEVRVRDGLRGKAYLPDGRAVTMRDEDMALRIDDAPLATGDFGERLVFQNPVIAYGPAHPARVALAARADGSIVVAPFDGEMRPPYALLGRIMLVSQTEDGVGGPLGIDGYNASEGIGVTVVPGGSNADPWTGRVPKVDAPPAPSRQTVASEPGALSEPPAEPEDAGCGGGSGSSALLGLIAMPAARRRRKRPPATT